MHKHKHKVVSLLLPKPILMTVLMASGLWNMNLNASEAPAPSFDPSPSNIIVEYDVGHNLVPSENTPRMQIFGDGRVQVFYPAYMKRAGSYSYQLTPDELQDILGELVEAGLSTTSTETYEASVARSRSSSELFEVSDATTVSVSLNLSTGGSNASTAPPSTLVASELHAWRSKETADSLISSLGEGFDVLEQLTTDSRMVQE